MGTSGSRRCLALGRNRRRLTRACNRRAGWNPGADLRRRSPERTLVWAWARSPAADAQFVRRTRRVAPPQASWQVTVGGRVSATLDALVRIGGSDGASALVAVWRHGAWPRAGCRLWGWVAPGEHGKSQRVASGAASAGVERDALLSVACAHRDGGLGDGDSLHPTRGVCRVSTGLGPRCRGFGPRGPTRRGVLEVVRLGNGGSGRHSHGVLQVTERRQLKSERGAA